MKADKFTACPEDRGSEFKVVKMQQADARFLRRILFAMVMLTLATGTMAGYTTVGAMSAQGTDLCHATGLLCTR